MSLKKNSITEFTMKSSRVNLYSFLMIIPSTIILLTPFALIWGLRSIDFFKIPWFDFFLLTLIGGVILHEFLHAITWSLFVKNGFRSISFGFCLKSFSPYCHCSEPIKVKHFMLGCAMPLIVMGFIPVIIATIYGSFFWLAIGIFFTWVAGGDIISLYVLTKIDKNLWVYDHPSDFGFYIKDKELN